MTDYTKEDLKKWAKTYNDACISYINNHISKTGFKFKIKCEHESDGNIYTSNPPQNKCKHCKEFYR